jgi:Mg2+ and Co2+ transporter CorA
MLRTEYRFPIETAPQRLLAVLLGEAFLGFLAIVAVALTLFPMLFAVSPLLSAAIDTVQWIIIAWFGFEYVFAFASARAKSAFLLSPWRLLDLATILIPLASLLPTMSRALLSSPILRLIRLTRLITLGVRVSGVAVRRHALRASEATVHAPVRVTRMADAPEFSPTETSWDELLRWLRSPGREWYHVSHPSREELGQIAATAGLAPGFLEGHLFGANYPHLATAKNYAAMFLWMPEIKDGVVERHGVLFVASANSLLSLARRPTGAVARITASAPDAEEEAEKTPFALRMIGVVLDRVLQQNEMLVGAFEQELRGLEDIPIRDSSPAFFERTFRAKKELSAAQADLWRVKGMLADIAEGRFLPGVTGAASELFRRLTTKAEYLYESVVNVRDEILSVMELHLNIVSFDMNRVMRVLAVVSVLGLIPAVIGGLFGMNLVDNPWPFTLRQVAFAISFGMVLCLYFFFVKGWLR